MCQLATLFQVANKLAYNMECRHNGDHNEVTSRQSEQHLCQDHKVDLGGHGGQQVVVPKFDLAKWTSSAIISIIFFTCGKDRS